MDKHVPYKPPESGLSPQTTDPNEDTSMLMAQLMATHCYHSDPDESLNEHIEQQISHSFNIAESKYDLVPLEHVAKQQQHLNGKQQNDLYNVIKDFEPLFNGNLVRSGKLGPFKGPKAHLELTPEAKPFQNRPYSVPKSHEAVFKKTIDEMVQWGILEKCGPMDYLSPTFIVPKKDGRVRFVSDFWQLNKMIKRKVWLLPIIQDILKKRNGYKYFTKLDLSMFFYTFEMDEALKDLCGIVTPFGNYRYMRLPMGFKQSPDIAQAHIEQLLADFEEADVYIDNVGIFSNNWNSHMDSLRKILRILQDHGFTCNPLKCEFCVQETDWLGYWLMPTGIKPWKKKINAILRLKPSKSV
ncbi:unnamed protein product [Cylindrotheca closterium]|uniref:Reverse transcriptase domain-containing protein n=1 Tax=Cylindrotheca closterium TaxID=2856 RepID=A0AAD2CJI7_9STRA|nr:unnamed protein product [Cylindrotheca closterium]